MQRRQDVEFIRIISSFAIVWFHSGAVLGEVFYGGLIVFLVLTFYFAGCNEIATVNYLPRRAKRLLVPWLVWFTIYGAINILNGKSLIPLNSGILAGILTGPSLHLWYLPFNFICLVLFDFVRKYVSPPFLGSASAALVTLILVSAPVWRIGSIQAGCPFAQYAHALAGVFLGIFFSFFYVASNALLLLFLIIVAAVLVIPSPGIGIPYLIGIAAGCVVIFPYSSNLCLNGVGLLSPYMFGVYLVHPLLMRIIMRIPHINGIMVPMVAFISATIIVFLIKKHFPRMAKFCF